MKPVFAAVQPVLMELGYRRSGSTFNRVIEPDGLVHVVEFDRCGSVQTVPGERWVTTQYGAFFVELGVWLPGVWQQIRVPMEWNDAMERKPISSGSCHQRERLGSFFPVPCDYHWPVADGEAAQVVAAGLTEYGLPWLDGYLSWDQVLHQFEDAPGYRLLAMGMRLARGEHDIAERDFEEHLAFLAAGPGSRALQVLKPDHTVAWFIESLERIAVAHHFDVDVLAFAAQARRREQEERQAIAAEQGQRN
jgi:Domain of unknown function (DUF4304)